jgi:NADPH-dependent 2,4-dienoyl-CoA reductase/sulfur reductase-like enzyme
VSGRLVIIGGSDAGIMAGLRAREVDPSVRPLLVVADACPNFSICGIPDHVSGDVPDTAGTAAPPYPAGAQRAGRTLRSPSGPPWLAPRR